MRTHVALATLAALLVSTTMAYAEKVDTGVEPDVQSGVVLLGVINKDGVVVSSHPFSRQFESVEACEALVQLPLFSQVRAQLDAFAAAHFPGSTTAVSCEKSSQ